jgi:hypothetical protein
MLSMHSSDNFTRDLSLCSKRAFCKLRNDPLSTYGSESAGDGHAKKAPFASNFSGDKPNIP